MVSGSLKTAQLSKLSGDALERNRIVADADNEDVRTLVSCGQSLPEQQIAIVHPETLTVAKLMRWVKSGYRVRV